MGIKEHLRVAAGDDFGSDYGTDVRPVIGGGLTPLTDAATFNSTFDWFNSTGRPTHIQDLVNDYLSNQTLLRDKPVLPHGDIIIRRRDDAPPFRPEPPVEPDGPANDPAPEPEDGVRI